MPRLLTILGARPQFIKAAALTRVIAENPEMGWSQDILHTGQHYDNSLSKVFFDTLDLPQPRWQFNLDNFSAIILAPLVAISFTPSMVSLNTTSLCTVLVW